MIKRFGITLFIALTLLAPAVLVSAEPVAAAPVIAQSSDDKDKEKNPNGNNSRGDNNDNGQRSDNKNNGPLQNSEGENRDPVSEKTVKDTSVVEYISDAYRWLSIIGGLLAVIMLIYAGYSYMSSNGDPEKISNSKDIVEKALLGLALLIIATVILQTINPRTVDPCKPGQPGCGTIDFTDPNGGVKEN